MVRRNHIIILILINITFGYGQVQNLEPACAESTQLYGVSGFADSEFIWSFDSRYGTILDGNGTDTITIRWGYATGNVQLEVLEVTSQNCSNVPSIALIEIMAPEVDLGYEFPEICDQDSLILDAGEHYEPEFSFLWHDGSTRSYYIGRNTEQIWVRVTDGFGCVRYDTISLLVNDLPSVYLGGDALICEGYHRLVPEDTTMGGDNYVNYIWHISSVEDPIEGTYYLDLEPNFSDFIDTVIVEVEDFNSCWSSDTMLLYPCNYEGLFKEMPNTLTPDGDGANDTWVIPYMDYFENAVLEIFDRWGRLVYRTTSVYEEPWDGKSGGKDMPMDSYYFVLDLKAPGSKPLVGTVNLIR